MSKGGKREGAGRPPKTEPHKVRRTVTLDPALDAAIAALGPKYSQTVEALMKEAINQRIDALDARLKPLRKWLDAERTQLNPEYIAVRAELREQLEALKPYLSTHQRLAKDDLD